MPSLLIELIRARLKEVRKMNIHLVNFYKTWLHWATHENAANPAEFSAENGLCDGLFRYCNWLGLAVAARHEVIIAMVEQFEKHGLDSTTPFNRGDVYYYDELDKRKNKARSQWCIDRIAEAEGHD